MIDIRFLHDYLSFANQSMLYGIPVNKSVVATRQIHYVEVIPFKKRWWKPWDNLRTVTKSVPAIYQTNLPGFGKRIIVHPDLYDEFMKVMENIVG